MGQGGVPGAPIYRRGWSGGGAGVMVVRPTVAGDAQGGKDQRVVVGEDGSDR